MSLNLIVIGAGHNGLVAAIKLAALGFHVTVLERAAQVGGLCAAEAFHPGFRAPGVLHDTVGVRARVVESLHLKRFGFSWRETAPPMCVVNPQGRALMLDRDPSRCEGALSQISEADAAGYRAWRGFLDKIRPVVLDTLNQAPPPMSAGSKGDLWRLGKRGLGLRRLGGDSMLELMRIAPQCVDDWLSEAIPSPLLREALAWPGLLGNFAGPRSAGTAASLLLYECGADRPVRGGGPGLIEALMAAVEDSRRITIRTSSRVSSIRVAGGRVVGVTLEDGEAIDAAYVLATCDPKQTLLELVHPSELALQTHDAVRVIRMRGTTAKVNLALSGPLEVAGVEGEMPEHIRVGSGHPMGLERAFDAVKYGRWSEQLHLDILLPSVAESGWAPEGQHVASIQVSFVPLDLKGGWDDRQRKALGETVLSRLEAVAPGCGEKVLARQVLTPADLEARGLTGGHLYHGEHSLDQLLFMRPVPAAAQYRTPIEGLYLGGSGSHPGGGITGMPGLLAAETIISSLV